MKKCFLICCLFLLSISKNYAVIPTSEGTDFWLTFMNNDNVLTPSRPELTLVISSQQDASVTILNPQTAWETSFSVKANEITTFVVDKNQAYTFNAESIEKTGIRVSSTSPIYLYAANFFPLSYDATNVLPTSALGTNYVIQTCESAEPNGNAKEFAVVATENNTSVTIVPHARTTKDNIKNVPIDITLQQGEVYQIMSSDIGSYLSGSLITADKPVAVFAGHQRLRNAGYICQDHIVEQQIPIELWGRTFAVTQTAGRNEDIVGLTSCFDNTDVYINGEFITKLSAYDTYEFILKDRSAFIQTSKPAACFLYLSSETNSAGIGDPSSVYISPLEQSIFELHFSTFENPNGSANMHFLNIVTTEIGKDEFTLDGISQNYKFSPLTGNNKLYFAQIPITHGMHTMQTLTSGFIGHVYGYGSCESYAYSAGLATRNLIGNILLNGNSFYEDTYCYLKTFTFSPNTNATNFTAQWDLGDGTTSSDKSVTHQYSSPGSYQIRLIVSSEDVQDTSYMTLNLIHRLNQTIKASICSNDSFFFNGTFYKETGSYNYITQSVDGCDSLITLILTVNDVVHAATEEKSTPLGKPLYWHRHFYKEEGYYYDTLLTVNGCDSILQLHLTTVNQLDSFADTLCYTSPYTFNNIATEIPDFNSIYPTDSPYIKYIIEDRDYDNCSRQMVTLVMPTMQDKDFVLFDTIKIGTTYSFFDQTLTHAGTYSTSVSPGFGCNENTYTLHLATVPHAVLKLDTFLCFENETIKWRGLNIVSPGYYTDSVYLDGGKDNALDSVLYLTVVNNRHYDTLYVNSTESEYLWPANGLTYQEPGIYHCSKSNINDCDSLLTLYLNFGPNKCKMEFDEWYSLCEGNKISRGGSEFYKAGNYTVEVPISSEMGCDSTIHLHITTPQDTTLPPVFLCEGDFYKYNGEPLYENKSYEFTLTSAAGCDSLVKFSIIKIDTSIVSIFKTIDDEDSYSWNGIDYKVSGIYKRGFIKSNGCDSIVQLHLTFQKQPISITIDTSICQDDTLFIGEKQYYEAGSYVVDTIRTANEKDSITNLILNIKTSPKTIINDTLADEEVYEWNDMIIKQGGQYVVTYTASNGCDSVVILNLFSQNPEWTMLINVPCAEKTQLILTPTVTSGKIQQFHLSYSDKEHSQHFRDTTVFYYASESIYIPIRARAGTYTVTITPLYENLPYKSQTYSFLVPYPASVLDQHWDDFIAVLNHDYNGGYDFISFQWYKDSIPIIGQTRSYLYTPLEFGHQYSALLEERGQPKMLCCPIIASHKEEISLYPTILNPKQIIRIKLNKSISVEMFSSSGKLIYKNNFESGDNAFPSPGVVGVYSIIITTEDNITYIKKIIVR